MVATLDCYLFNARKVRKVVISEKRPKALNNTFIATHGVFLFPVQWTMALRYWSRRVYLQQDSQDQKAKKGGKFCRCLHFDVLIGARRQAELGEPPNTDTWWWLFPKFFTANIILGFCLKSKVICRKTTEWWKSWISFKMGADSLTKNTPQTLICPISIKIYETIEKGFIGRQ